MLDLPIRKGATVMPLALPKLWKLNFYECERAIRIQACAIWIFNCEVLIFRIERERSLFRLVNRDGLLKLIDVVTCQVVTKSLLAAQRIKIRIKLEAGEYERHRLDLVQQIKGGLLIANHAVQGHHIQRTNA